MKSKILFSIFILFLLSFCSFFLIGADLPDQKTQTGFYHGGDPERGRKIFIEFKCMACHRVKADADLPPPIAAKQGPLLGAQYGNMSAKELMDSILTPSHRIESMKDISEGGTLSRMPDYKAVLTAQELIDLITYLRWAQD